MNLIKNVKLKCLLGSLMLLVVFFACEDKDYRPSNNKTPIIEAVFSYNTVQTEDTLTQARVGSLLRITGSGFAGIDGVFCNGVNAGVNPNYVTDTNILFEIPATIPVGIEADSIYRNTIRLTKGRKEVLYEFTIQGPPPSITAVSHTLPDEGDVIYIYGAQLQNLDTIKFPGDVSILAENFEVNTDGTMLTCTVPVGGASTPGPLFITGINGSAFSYNYMNRKECVVIENFSADATVEGYPGRVYAWGSNISATSGDPLGADSGLPGNPAAYRYVPAATSTIVPGQVVGGFNFKPDIAVGAVILSSNGSVKADMSCNDLALQFDYYISGTWNSGYIRVELLGGNALYRHSFAPWSETEDSEIEFEGWATATIPLGVFSALSGRTLEYLESSTSGSEANLRFINDVFTDIGGTDFEAQELPDFQFAFGKVRIVPYIIGPAVESEDPE